MKAASWHRLTVAGVAALALIEFAWELWLAPLLPRGSWLALKALPLALLWPGLAHGRRRTRQWISLLLPLYAGEGVVRALSESGRHAAVAWVATTIACATFIALLVSFRMERNEHGASPSAPRTL